jgi:general secretion pathway protein J
MKKNQRGFTLLEVLFAVSILSLVVTVIYASFSGAARNVKEAEAIRDRTDMARTLIARLSDDIANAYYKSPKDMIFYGKQTTQETDKPRLDNLSLTTLTNWRRPASRETDLWEVGYRFDEKPDGSGKVLVRREKREFAQDNKPLEGGTDMEITDQVRELRLRYSSGLVSAGTTSLTWEDEWDSRVKGFPPKIVEIRLLLENGNPYLTLVDVGYWEVRH